ncbi:hypothetical protein vBVpPAC2_50 [Vibrio phage vB_VpP_AC2]|uniref:Uncharacterized protein n=1 Tax=Vibrio phage vB_VpP_AC2 TaxID=2961842 RepID=A0A9E7T1L4_9CAUD|nr:hypothetical protein vBVpPAC2_50 [Vibrio phage vB_VpP_AC2]
MALNARELQFLRENYGTVGKCLSKQGVADALDKTYNEISHAIRYNGITTGDKRRSGRKLTESQKRELVQQKDRGRSSEFLAGYYGITPQHVCRVYRAAKQQKY